MLGDTIAAVSTPPGRGGIGVVRLSGPGAVECARPLLKSSSPKLLSESHRAVLADVVLPELAAAVDQAVVTLFASPRSYTGEDVVEIACHGSPVVLQSVLDALLRSGARCAMPGEFTLRAFLNGRVDLTQAEAVRDLIDAQTLTQARTAQRHLRGELAGRLEPVRLDLLSTVVHLESAVEFVEDDIEPDDRRSLAERLETASSAVSSIAETYNVGRLLSQGLGVAIIGPPNAGKSSIFNRLLGIERAIVTPIAGTTRDAISERIVWDGIPMRLVDTAGIRETQDPVEQIGVARSLTALADADVILVVFDAEATDQGEAEAILAQAVGLRIVVVANKIDRAPLPDWLSTLVALHSADVLGVSALSGENIEQLREMLLKRGATDASLGQDSLVITNARQHALLSEAAFHLGSAARALREGMSEEYALAHLHGALRAFDDLVGKTTIDDILNSIFATFCIGK